ncbi:hypothetical protein H5U35_00675 [Candidatus Aerophobetes bacterium]|nr:hypothetical protein [Candidatus Aerophobetes bacterium]
MEKGSLGRSCLGLLFVFFLVTFAGVFVVQADEPERGFLIFFKYPKVTVAMQDKFQFEITVKNIGKKEETIYLSIVPDSKAKGWDTSIETKWDKMEIGSLTLLAKGEAGDDYANLYFIAKPPQDVKEGEYHFTVKGVSADGKIKTSAPLTLCLKGKEEVVEEEAEEVELTADYPSIENPAGTEFKFAIKVQNKTDKAMVLNLGAEYPYGWRAYCTPRWEEDKKISSIKVDANGYENLLLTLVPPPNVKKGEYPIKFGVRSENLTKTIDLKATVIGTYDLKMGTETGRVSLEAIAGKKETLSLYIWNEGSAPIEDITFFAIDTPTDWKVSFEPEKIASLPPYQETKKPEKIELTVTPPPRSLPGDYIFTVKAAGKQDTKEMELRVTIKSSTAWGWIGIGIVGVIIGSLVGIFTRLGRR